jgi:DHA1 family bicyclomycin/chloramphenicol resistance-like MFS transporter
LLVGVTMQVVAVIALAVIILTGQISAWTVLPGMFVLATSMGFIFGPATALAMVEVRFASGTALAIMGSTQFLAAAVSATLIGIVSTNSLDALAIVSGGAVALVVVAVVIGSVSGRRTITETR